MTAGPDVGGDRGSYAQEVIPCGMQIGIGGKQPVRGKVSVKSKAVTASFVLVMVKSKHLLMSMCKGQYAPKWVACPRCSSRSPTWAKHVLQTTTASAYFVVAD